MRTSQLMHQHANTAGGGRSSLHCAATPPTAAHAASASVCSCGHTQTAKHPGKPSQASQVRQAPYLVHAARARAEPVVSRHHLRARKKQRGIRGGVGEDCAGRKPCRRSRLVLRDARGAHTHTHTQAPPPAPPAAPQPPLRPRPLSCRNCSAAERAHNSAACCPASPGCAPPSHPQTTAAAAA